MNSKLMLFICSVLVTVPAIHAEDKPIYKAITQEVMRPNGDPEGRPLPLALHKPTNNLHEEDMVGFATPKGISIPFSLDRVLDDIDAGHHVMPFLDWPRANVPVRDKVGFIQPTEVLIKGFKRLAATKMPFDLECGNFEDAMFLFTPGKGESPSRDAAEEFWNRPAKNNPAFLDNALQGRIAEPAEEGATSVKVNGFAPGAILKKSWTFLFDSLGKVIKLREDVTIDASGEATLVLQKGLPAAVQPGEMVIRAKRSMDFLSDASPDLWRQGGRNMATKDWGATEDLWKRFAEIYPDPPQIQVLGSYEGGGKTSLPDAGKSWHAVQRKAEFEAAFPEARGISPMRQAFAQNYIEKMGAYLAGIREGLPWPEDRIKLIGNNAFGVNFEVGRWYGWAGNIVPTQNSDCYLWETWDGSLPDFYVYDWNYATDEHVGSPHIGAMQAYSVLADRAIKQVPGFLWQLGFWNGGQTKRYRYATLSGIPVSSIAGTTVEAMTAGGATALSIRGAKPDSLVMREGELFTIAGHSEATEAPCRAIFDEVKFSNDLPVDLKGISIGAESPVGELTREGENYVVSGFGTTMTNTPSEQTKAQNSFDSVNFPATDRGTPGTLFFAGQPLGAATRIQARVLEVSNPDRALESGDSGDSASAQDGNPDKQPAGQKKLFDAQMSGDTSMARAGLMLRADNLPDAAFFSVIRLASGKLAVMWRSSKGGKFGWSGWEDLVKTPDGPVSLAIERSPNTKKIKALWSTDGIDWKVLKEMECDLGGTPSGGLMASSWASPHSLRVYTAGADVWSDAEGNATIALAISQNGKAIAITERYGPIAQGAEVRIHDYMPRVEGLSNMALWISRPRIIRQFGWADFNGQIDAEWKALLRATDAVWNDATLTRFWRKGTLVPNPDYQKETGREHPMGLDLDKEPWKSLWAGEDRFFQLTVDINPPFKLWPKDNDVSDTSPANVNGRIKVWAIAYELGEAPNREWLLIVQSPTQDRRDVDVKVPGFGEVKVDVAQRGSFYHLREGISGFTPVGTATAPKLQASVR